MRQLPGARPTVSRLHMSLKKKNHRMVTGEALLIEIAATQEPIRLRRGLRDMNACVSPEAALRLILQSPHGWEGKARTGRVFWMRPTTGKPVELDPHFLDDRAVIRFHPDQSSGILKVKNARLAALWSRVVSMDPPSARFRRPV